MSSIDPIPIVVYDLATGLPLAGLTPSFASPGFYKTAAGVAATPPTITDNGDGSYSFVPSATDLNTGIRYLMDAGVLANPRFYDGTIESEASAAVQTTVDPEDLNLFGVTAASLYARHFPQVAAAVTDSNPSLAAVMEIIDEQAAALSGFLLAEDIDALSLTVSNSPAYLWCRETLRLMAAIQVAAVMVQAQVPLLPAWEKQLETRLKNLAEQGYLALGGGVSPPAEQPDGPTHFIDALGLDTSENDEFASGVTMPLRKDDLL